MINQNLIIFNFNSLYKILEELSLDLNFNIICADNEKSLNDKIQNINFLFANNGYGFGYEYEKFRKSNVSIGLDLRFYDIRNDEFPIYDPFYNQFTVAGEKDILLFPLFFKTNYYLFDGQIANSFRPYITFSVGPFIAVDGDETISSFSKK